MVLELRASTRLGGLDTADLLQNGFLCYGQHCDFSKCVDVVSGHRPTSLLWYSWYDLSRMWSESPRAGIWCS